jgi:putative ABC transport system permease protein
MRSLLPVETIRLLRLISWPYVRRHLIRSLLSVLAITLGIASVVAMRTANQSILTSFNQTVQQIAGKAQLQISAGDTGFPEDVLDRVQSAPEVRAAAPVIEAALNTSVEQQTKLLVLAVDFTGDRSLRDYAFDQADDDIIDDPLAFLAQPDSLIITQEFAGRHRLHNGDRLQLSTAQGPRLFTVRGILKAGGLAAAFGGDLAIMDIYAAQQVFGRGRRFDRIDVGLSEGVSIARGRAALRRILGDGFTIESPSTRGEEFESLVRVYSLGIKLSSVLALFTGMFIIYNSFAISVNQRRREIGIIRALGGTRRQIRRLFLAESACAGFIGATLGLEVGLLSSRSITAFAGRMLEGVFGIVQNPQVIPLDARSITAVVLLGIVTSMIAAWIPARNAANVEPVRALQKGTHQTLVVTENRARHLAAVGLVVFAIVCPSSGERGPFFYAGYIAMALAGLFLTPLLTLALSRLLRVPLRWVGPVEAVLAADSLIQAPRRTSSTVAALMLSIAMVIGTGGLARANYEAIAAWANERLDADLFVSPSESIVRHDVRFPDSLRSKLEAVPGVAEVQPVRTAHVSFRGRQISLLATDYGNFTERWRLRPPVAGDARTMYRLVSDEEAFIVSENLANLMQIRLGEILELNTPSGPVRKPVAGVLRDFGDMAGTIFMERKMYVRFFQDHTADVFRVYVNPAASLDDVRSKINTQVGSTQSLFVAKNRDVREYVISVANQWFGMTYIQVFVAVGVAILGIANTITVSILDRRRELGLLRSLGGFRNQVRRTIWIEAAMIGLIGFLLGSAIGAINLYYELQAIGYGMTGMILNYAFPLRIAITLLPVILCAACVAAILPAEVAVRSSLIEALEYE